MKQLLLGGVFLFVIAAIGTGIGVTSASASGTDIQSNPAPVGTNDDVIKEGELTCSTGYWTCPDDGFEYDYAAPSCIDVCGAIGTKTATHTLCENHCTAACFATEWFNC